ncbi:MAG: SAM-dependent methyltransferase [Bacteroidetes bacterium]|nr:MAG: SAM-dependent methyltransferase [Bacteroidota bacterium]
MQQTHTETFLEKFSQAFQQKKLVKLTLSKPRDKKADLKNIIITPVNLKKGLLLNFVYRYSTRDITKNFDLEEASEKIWQAMEKDFLLADMYAAEENLKFMVSPSGKVKLKTHAVIAPVPVTFSHDRKKERLVEPENNIYLRELGVTNEKGEVKHDKKDKFLQINRYLELLQPEIKQLPAAEILKIADMGSGKGYLTFALYDYLVNRVGVNVEMTGVEFRNDLVKTCNDIAINCGFINLEFLKGTIEEAEIDDPDILIALHACDTATDDAIYRGIQAGSSLIVCAPCCHKQIRKEFSVTSELSSVLKHGILEERQAEIITDGLRALLMEAHGYKTRVFEFISTEHTPKNLMIVGRKISSGEAARDKALNNIQKIKEMFGVKEHYLEGLLKG